jgi:muconolactone delta-isomerase
MSTENTLARPVENSQGSCSFTEMANILVCGRIKQGKTTLAIFLAHEHSPGVIVWDPRHMQRGFIVRPPIAENLEDAIKEKAYLHSPIVIWPSGDLETEFAEVCSVLFNPPERFSGDGKGNGGFAFVVDEAADLQKAQSINDSLRIVVKQHPRAVNVIQCTHSLQEWNRSSKDTMSHLYLFRLQGRSLTYAVEYADVDDEEELTQVLRSLPEHSYVHVDFESVPGAPAYEVCEPLHISAVEAIQIGAKPKFLDKERKESFNANSTSRETEGRERRGSGSLVGR